MSVLRKRKVIRNNEANKLAVINALFAAEFADACATELIGGADEPLYLPAGDADRTAKIFYRQDFLASALHEVAHWCIAGKDRRAMKDFGYWYNPEGRSAAEQIQFESVEVKPQALEWMFSVACKKSFHVSADNITSHGENTNDESFKWAVVLQAQHWCLPGSLPARGQQFVKALMAHYNTDATCSEYYQLKHLR